MHQQQRTALERKSGGDESPVDVKNAVISLKTAFEEFKRTNDQRLDEIKKHGTASADTEAKLAKITADMDRFEGLNQRVTAAEAEAKAAKDAAKAAEEHLHDINLKAGRPGTGKPGSKSINVNDWARAAIGAFTMGVPNLTEPQQKALLAVEAEYKSLSISNDATGGYLAPSEYVREIIKTVTLISPVRSLARVRQTASKSILLPKRVGQFAATRTAEQGNRSETAGLSWGMLEIHAPEMYALIDISQQNLEDSAFDLESEIMMEAAEQFAVLEGSEFVSGTGVNQMEGILTNANIATTNSGSATLVTADGLIALKYGVKTAYERNARFVMNRTTLGHVRALKDSQNRYLWAAGDLSSGMPNTIDGSPYAEVPDMPNEGANTYPVAFGDFMRGFTIVDRIAMQLLRDPYTQATSGNLRFLFRRRSGGMVTQPEAIRKLKCST